MADIGGLNTENVLLVVLDTVRADSTFQEGRDITPTLAQVANSGTTFEKAIAPAPWSLPSHASMFTGLYPTEHGATNYNRGLPTGPDTFAEILSKAGYETGLFTANGFLTDIFDMSRGFDKVSFSLSESAKLFDEGADFMRLNHQRSQREEREGLGSFIQMVANQVTSQPIIKNIGNFVYFLVGAARRQIFGRAGRIPRWDANSVNECQTFMREHADEGFCSVVNLIQAHAPWPYERDRVEAIGVEPTDIAPESKWEAVANQSESQWQLAAGEISFTDTERKILLHLYESWVHSSDRLAGKLLKTLDKLNIRDETLVILTSDHGESIARDGILDHELTLHKDVTHVPLVMSGPSIPNNQITAPVSLKDIYYTVLEHCGIETNHSNLMNEYAQGFAFTETYGPNPDRVDEKYRHIAESIGHRRAIVTPEGQAERRYTTGESFGSEELIERLDTFSAELDKRAKQGDKINLNGKPKERLKDLGYIN